eukprot:3084200-Ditylum_brightwellii.AAC.1
MLVKLNKPNTQQGWKAAQTDKLTKLKWNDTPGDQYLSEGAIKMFLTSSSIPLIFGAFGEINTEFLTFMKTATLAAASTKEGL